MEMTAVESVFSRMADRGSQPALFWREREVSYSELAVMVEAWRDRFAAEGIGPGSVCAVVGDFSPEAVAMIIAGMRDRVILVPFTKAIAAESPPLMRIAGVEHLVHFDEQDHCTLARYPVAETNPLIATFRKRGAPGLVVFTSGSTGEPKGILHDIDHVAMKFVEPRRGWRTVLFLLMDHFGGFNTFLAAIAYGGVGVCLNDRTPPEVCRMIERSRAELLPTTPTFLNFLVASGSYRDFDLSSVRLVTYGTEVMAATTLAKVRSVFPLAQIKQTYGLSEVGVLRSKSESDGSVWMKVGGRGFEVKVIDSVLWIRSEANMVGYLNAADPFDDDGWLCTGDQVEVQGEYIRVLGRKSELVNVGGQKVYPVEVETVLLGDSNVTEAMVYGVAHPLMGHVLEARVSLRTNEGPRELTERLRKLCLANLAKYKVPVRFTVVSGSEQHTARFKKVRLVDDNKPSSAPNAGVKQ